MSALVAARELRSFLRRHGARGPGTAAAALSGLSLVVPADCSSLSVWDPAAGRHRTLATSYPASLTGFLDGEMHTDPLYTHVRCTRVPTRVRDIDVRRRHGRIFDRIVTPSGFRDGVTHCLFTSDDRYVGMLNASTMSSTSLDDDVVALLELLEPDLAAALDPVAPMASLAHRLEDGVTHGFLVAADGAVEALSSRPRTDLLRRVPALAAAARHPDGGELVHRLLVVDGSTVHEADVCRTVRGTVVLHREVAPPDRLTVRELQVLEGLARGLSNGEIGRELGIGARTVATHVERALVKTGTRNRAEAAGRAARWGLCLSRVSPG